jgi:hypothetical protein
MTTTTMTTTTTTMMMMMMTMTMMTVTQYDGEIRKAANELNEILKIYDMKISTISME